MSKHFTISLILLGSVALPGKVFAGVVINEIAWMGTSVSANAEWIELFNDGTDSVSLSGWTLTSAGTAPNITLTGSVLAGGYYLLERTSDASVPSVSAHQIYTGALANGGDTLTLKDSTGVVKDTVVGGTGWSAIGGDNTTKNTPQRNGSTWSTGTPTPGTLNISGTVENSDEDDETESTATTTPTVTIQGSVATALPSTIEVTRLYIDAGPPRIVQREVPVLFEATAYDKYGSKRDARMSWSFGNGERLSGKSLWYTYQAPGMYTITVRADDSKKDGTVLVPVHVIDAQVSIKEMSQYGVVVENSDDAMVDFSNWLFAQGSKTFTVPPDTVLQGHSAVTFTYQTLEFSPGVPVELFYPTGVKASELPLAHEEKPEALSPELLLREEESELPITIHTHEPHIRAPATRNSTEVAGAYTLTPILFQEEAVVSP